MLFSPCLVFICLYFLVQYSSFTFTMFNLEGKLVQVDLIFVFLCDFANYLHFFQNRKQGLVNYTKKLPKLISVFVC
jgi:hypothetical protein